MSETEILIKIQRYDPQKDTKPAWKSYNIRVQKDWTILNILNHIRWNIDGTLAYRRSCGSAICGSCAMQVNGQNVLTCKTPFIQFKKNKLNIKPLPGFDIIKDLVVDMDPFFDTIHRIKPYLITDKPLPDKEFLQNPESYEAIRESILCILCGACTSACPSLWANKNFLGPASLLKAYRYIFDSRDDAASLRLEILNGKNGLWRCHTIFNCMEACPKNINITEFISRLKVFASLHSV